jgi:SAM-dependent methyltransferase
MADWDAMMGVDLRGTFMCCRYALEPMLAQGSGSIVNIATVHTAACIPGAAPYDAAKWGVSDFYEDTREGLLRALQSGEAFDTGWYSVKKEIESGRVYREDGAPHGMTITCEAACSDDFDDEGPGDTEVIVQHGDAYALPYEDGTFYTVCAFEMLEHLDEPQRVVDECARVLLPGGTFVASSPKFGVMGPDKYPDHTQDFTADAFVGMAAAAGLTLVEYKVAGLFQMMTAVKP